MKRKILGILICMLFSLSFFSTLTNANTFFVQEENSYVETYLLNFLNDPPYVPSSPDPTNNSIDVNVTTNISWTGGDPDTGDKVTYNVFFGIEENPPNVANTWEIETYDPGRLDYNIQYYWRIDSYDGNHGVTEGPLWTFNTADDQPPHQPSSPDPTNNSIDVNVTTNISWTGGDPDGDSVEYDVYFGTDPNPPNVITNYTTTTYDLDRLDYNTQYYWRIDAWDDYGYSTTGHTWSFTTRDDNPPNVPSNPYPLNESTNINTNVELSWTGGDPDGDSVEYDVYFGTDPNPPNVATGYLNTTYVPGTLELDTWYYWRIDAWDDYGYSTTGHTWKFRTTIYDSNPPNKPNMPNGPTNGRPGISYTYTSNTTDPDLDQIFYMFDWDDGTDSGWIGPYPSGENVEASHVWDTRGSYSIKVKAKDEYDVESIWSDTLPINMPKNKQDMPLGIILAFGFDVDVKIVQLEPGEDYVDLEVLSKPLYIWENEIQTINSGAFIRLYFAKGFFLPSVLICFGICEDWSIIG